MKINGKLTAIVAEGQGVSNAGTPWTKATLLLEVQHSTSSETFAVVAFNDKLEAARSMVGQMVVAQVWASYREYNGRYYQDITLSSIGLAASDGGAIG